MAVKAISEGLFTWPDAELVLHRRTCGPRGGSRCAAAVPGAATSVSEVPSRG